MAATPALPLFSVTLCHAMDRRLEHRGFTLSLLLPHIDSPTNNIFLAIRIIEPDPSKYDALKAGFRAYPYKDRAKATKGV